MSHVYTQRKVIQYLASAITPTQQTRSVLLGKTKVKPSLGKVQVPKIVIINEQKVMLLFQVPIDGAADGLLPPDSNINTIELLSVTHLSILSPTTPPPGGNSGGFDLKNRPISGLLTVYKINFASTAE